MKLQFINEKDILSDVFEVKDIPYKIGDIIDLKAIDYYKVEDKKELGTITNITWNNTYKIVEIIHFVKFEHILSQNYTYQLCLIKLIVL